MKFLLNILNDRILLTVTFDAPSWVEEQQLEDVHIKLDIKKKK